MRVVWLVEMDAAGATKLLYATARPEALAAVEADRQREAEREGFSAERLARHLVTAPWVRLVDDVGPRQE